MWVKVSREENAGFTCPPSCSLCSHTPLTFRWPALPACGVTDWAKKPRVVISQTVRFGLTEACLSFCWSKTSFVFFLPFCCPTHAHTEQCPCEKWMAGWKAKTASASVDKHSKKKLLEQFPLLALKGSITADKRLSFFSFCVPAFDSFKTSNPLNGSPV